MSSYSKRGKKTCSELSRATAIAQIGEEVDDTVIGLDVVRVTAPRDELSRTFWRAGTRSNHIRPQQLTGVSVDGTGIISKRVASAARSSLPPFRATNCCISSKNRSKPAGWCMTKRVALSLLAL